MKKTFLGRLLIVLIASQLFLATAGSQVLTDPFVPEPVTNDPGGQPDQGDIPIDQPDQDDGVPDQDDGIPTDPDQG